MKKNFKITYLTESDSLSLIKENNIYLFGISRDGYGEYLCIKNIKDKLLVTFIDFDKERDSFIPSDGNSAFYYNIFDFSSVKNDSVDNLYNNILDSSQYIREYYDTEKLNFLHFNSQVNPFEITEDIMNEWAGKIYAVEINEERVKTIYIQDNKLSNALDKADKLWSFDDNSSDFDYYFDHSVAGYEVIDILKKNEKEKELE